MHPQQSINPQQNIQIYLRNNKKIAYLVTIPRESSTQYLINLCSKIFKLEKEELLLFRTGSELSSTKPLMLKDKEIIHIINLTNTQKQEITVSIKHGKISNPFRVNTSATIKHFIETHLFPTYQKEGLKIILVYIGKRLDQQKTFRSQNIEEESQILLFYIKQPIKMSPQAVSTSQQQNQTQSIAEQDKKGHQDTKQLSLAPQESYQKSLQNANNYLSTTKIVDQSYCESNPQEPDPQFQHLKQYEQLFNNPQLAKIASNISPRLKQFYQKLGQLFLKHIKINRIEQVYSDTIFQLLKTIHYNSNPMESPYCSRPVTQHYQCRDCSQGNNQFQTCFCSDCFALGNHQGHNFRYFNGQSAQQISICDCGDKEYLKHQSFCHKHKGEDQNFIIPEQHSGEQQLFVKEMQFVLYLFLKLKDVSKEFMDQNKKKEIIAIHFVGKIGSFVTGSFINQNILASFFSSKFSFPYPFCSNKQKGKTILSHIFSCQKYGLFLRIFCIKLLLQMYSVRKMREIVITEYFSYANSSKTYLKEENPISEIGFHYLSAGEIICQLLRQKKIRPFAVNYKFENFKEKSMVFLQMYQNYNYILSVKNQGKLTCQLLQRLNTTKLYNYCSPKEQKLNKNVVVFMDIQYFKILGKIIKIVKEHPLKQELLKKIISENYCQLKSKPQSLSLSANRTLSLALFAYFNFSIQNIMNMQVGELVQLFDEKSKDSLVQSVQLLIKKWAFILKIDNFNYYKETFIKQTRTYSGKVILSIDHIYIKLLFYILLKMQHSPKSSLNLVLEQFVKKRQKVLGSLFDIFDSSDISRIEQTMDVMLSQVFLASNTLLLTTQSSISQTVVRDFFGQAQEQQLIDIYKLLIYKNKDINVKQFKKDAQSCTNNNLLLKRFIKNDFNKVKLEINKNQDKFVNVFNCSFNSYFLNFYSIAQINSLYSLKLANSRRSELSKIVFNDQMLDLIIRVTQWYLTIYQTSLKDNQIAASKRLLLITFDTLLTLYLQTLNRKVKNTIDSLLSKPYFNANADEYYKQIIEIYVTNNKKMQTLMNSSKNEQKNEENAIAHLQAQKQKKLLKKQEIKNKQMHALQKHKESAQNPQNSLAQQQKQKCIVCKSDSRTQRLNYLCYYRYSNLISQQLFKQNFPILIITTCGHVIHQECLFNNINSSNLNLFDYNCFLCKSRSNMIVPAQNQYSESLGKEFLTYLQLIETLVLEQSKGLIRALKEYEKLDFANRLIISIIYQIYGYSIYFPSFFQKNLLPVIKIAINFIKHMHIQIKASEYFSKIASNNSEINFTCDKFCKWMSQGELTSLKVEDWVLKTNIRPSLLYNLPEDLTDLNKQIGKCLKCQKLTSKLIICLICKLKICQGCNQNNLEHLNQHFGQTAFIHVENGLCSYHFSSFKSNIGFLYLDYIGEQLKNSATFPQKQEYVLSKQLKNNVVSDILNDDIPFKILQKVQQQRCVIQ